MKPAPSGITHVGGTEFAEVGDSYWASTASPNGGSALSYIPETAWNDTLIRNSLAASGGGASQFSLAGGNPKWLLGDDRMWLPIALGAAVVILLADRIPGAS